MKNKLTLLEIKQALWDQRFRDLFPEHQKEITVFLKDPGCACNVQLYRKLMGYGDRLQKYFPTKEITKEAIEEEVKKTPQNQWTVINCHIDKLEERLKKLPPGKKMISLARYQDQVTVVIDELVVF